MKQNKWIVLSLVMCLVGITTSQALAYNGLGSDWRNNYPDACQELQDATQSPQNCVMCHTGGFNLNPYGQDYKDAGLNFAAIEGDDSDGDGRTNGEEINTDCTLPGDPVSPADLNSWGSIKVLFR